MNKWIGQNKKAVEKIRARMRKKARAESAEARAWRADVVEKLERELEVARKELVAADERVRDYDKQEG